MMKKLIQLTFIVLATQASAQWTSDTTANTLVAAYNADDNKSVVTSDGKTCIVFWRSIPAPQNYELRLQVLDTAGYPQLGTNGALITDSIPMSTFTQQWSLALGNEDNLYIGVTGTNGNVGYALKVDTAGTSLWGGNGKNLGTGYLVRTLPLSGGQVIISWLDNSFNGNIQKFNTNGSPAWPNPVALNSYVPARSFEMSDGGNITIYHNLTSGINSVQYAQRYDANGVAQWSSLVQLFASQYSTAYNTKYFGAQDGDTIYYSYKLSHNSRFDAFIQRINPDGTLPFGVTGVDFDASQTNFEQEIKIAIDSSSPHIWAICRYTDASQNQQGVYVQKIEKSTGQRLLGNNAKALYALSTPGTAPDGDIQFYKSNPIFLIHQAGQLRATLLDSIGGFQWASQSKAVASLTAPKMRVGFHPLSSSSYVATFTEDKGNGSQVFAHKFSIKEPKDTSSVSISELSAPLFLQYANPIKDEVRIESNSAIKSVLICNTAGMVIYQQFNCNITDLSIDSQQWKPGIYIIALIGDGGNSKSIKVLKR